MSRSFKHVPGFVDHPKSGSKKDKRFANKKIRNTEDIPNGGSFKKIYESWNINDWKFLYFSMDEILEFSNINTAYKTWMK